jgi:hypothetical protein
MPLDDLWQLYQDEGYREFRDVTLSTAADHFYVALLAFGEGDVRQASSSARIAARLQPDNLVYVQAAEYLLRVREKGKEGVYVDGESFAEFVRGGSNIRLYRAVSEALRAIYQDYQSFSLLDIGVGDGMALLPALTDTISTLDLVEPSEAMLNKTLADLEKFQIPHSDYNMTIQDFMRDSTDRWDVIQATWSLQSLAPDERLEVFAWMRQHGKRVLIAEFDVPEFDNHYAPVRVRYIVDRYKQGLAEYCDSGERVSQGFLMPVMFGYFDRSAARTNYEEPIQAWVDKLRHAGFTDIKTQMLHRYWWADSYLIDAK